MYVDCVTNSGKPYLRVAESYSINENGVRKNRKRTVRNLGLALMTESRIFFKG